MDNLNGRHIRWRHDHPQAHPGHVEQARGEVEGHPDAAVGRRIPRQLAAVECDARPGDALHVRHEGIVIDVRVVVRLFLDDTEDTGGCLASLLAARHRRPENPAIGVIDGDPLAPERNDGQDRLAGWTRLDGFDRTFAPALRGARMIAGRDQHGESRNDEMREPRPLLLALRAHETRPHPIGTPQTALRRIITPSARTCQCGASGCS